MYYDTIFKNVKKKNSKLKKKRNRKAHDMSWIHYIQQSAMNSH